MIYSSQKYSTIRLTHSGSNGLTSWANEVDPTKLRVCLHCGETRKLPDNQTTSITLSRRRIKHWSQKEALVPFLASRLSRDKLELSPQKSPDKETSWRWDRGVFCWSKRRSCQLRQSAASCRTKKRCLLCLSEVRDKQQEPLRWHNTAPN